MERYQKGIETVLARSDIPGECVPGMPVVEIAGCNRVLIENHFGVCAYSRENICIKVRYGAVSISGECLELAKMNRYQMVITGRIKTVVIDPKR